MSSRCRKEFDTFPFQCPTDLLNRFERNSFAGFFDTSDHLTAYSRMLRQFILAKFSQRSGRSQKPSNVTQGVH